MIKHHTDTIERILASHRFATERLAKLVTIIQYAGKLIDTFEQKAHVADAVGEKQATKHERHGLRMR